TTRGLFGLDRIEGQLEIAELVAAVHAHGVRPRVGQLPEDPLDPKRAVGRPGLELQRHAAILLRAPDQFCALSRARMTASADSKRSCGDFASSVWITASRSGDAAAGERSASDGK